MATKELIKAATISRVSDKSGKFLGFGVKSNHSEKYYKIRCVKGLKSVVYSCDCEAKDWGHPVCNHIKAVRELVEARRQNELAVAATVAPLIVGKEFASDLNAYLDDEFSRQADAIVEAEYEARVQLEILALPDIDSSAQDEILAMQGDRPQVPGSCDGCGRASKKALCPWCLGVAA